MGNRLIAQLTAFIVAFAAFQMVFLSSRLPNNNNNNNNNSASGGGPEGTTNGHRPSVWKHTTTDVTIGSSIHSMNSSSSSSSSKGILRSNRSSSSSSGGSGTTMRPDQQHQKQQKQQGQKQQGQEHAIPRVLIFTYSKNLLTEDPATFDDEELVLAANVRHSIDVHTRDGGGGPQHVGPSSTTTTQTIGVVFYTDDDCVASLSRVYPSLVTYFKNETKGMYRADICRGSALYEHGGFYLDVDVGVRHDLWKDLHIKTEFVTAKVHSASKYPGHFFQAVMGCAPQSDVLLYYLNLFEKHYDGTDPVRSGPLGVILLKRAWDQSRRDGAEVTTATATTAMTTTGDDGNHGHPSNQRQQHQGHFPRTELYQEVLYRPELFPHLFPAPTWGVRRACHFVVIAAANHKENVEMTMMTTTTGRKGGSLGVQIPLYSRIGGSRMCPILLNGGTDGGNTTNTQNQH